MCVQGCNGDLFQDSNLVSLIQEGFLEEEVIWLGSELCVLLI